MKAIFDVDYRDADPATAYGLAACVVFQDWQDATPQVVLTEKVSPIAAYEPGAFYKREMPCILQTLQKVSQPIDLIIIDGFVWLGPDHPGLGAMLYDELNQKIPVIGVAKTKYYTGTPIEVLRGVSMNPLLITSVGIDVQQAAQHIHSMHGEFRIPTLLKLVDSTCRNG